MHLHTPESFSEPAPIQTLLCSYLACSRLSLHMWARQQPEPAPWPPGLVPVHSFAWAAMGSDSSLSPRTQKLRQPAACNALETKQAICASHQGRPISIREPLRERPPCFQGMMKRTLLHPSWDTCCCAAVGHTWQLNVWQLCYCHLLGIAQKVRHE